MTYIANRSSCATAAIAAVLALVSTSALAQEATATVDPLATPGATVTAPTVSTPTVQAPIVQAAPAAPAIVIPEVRAPVDSPAAAAGDATTASTRTQPTRTSARNSARTASSPAVSSPVSAAPRAATATPDAAAPVVAAAPVSAMPAGPASNAMTPTAPGAAPQPEVAAPVAPAATPSEPAQWALPIGILALLGIGGAAVLSNRRRRVIMEDPAYETTEAEAVVPEMASYARPANVPAATNDAIIAQTVGAPIPAVTDTPRTETMHVAAPSTTVDSRVPEDSERSALIARMVAAEPDAANPFKTARKRERRARLILQAAENRINAGQPAVDVAPTAERVARNDVAPARSAPARKPIFSGVTAKPMRPAFS